MSSRKARRKAKKQNDRLIDEAWTALERGEEALALRLVERALERGPANARYWYEGGQLLLHVGQVARGIGCLRQALVLAPDYEAARLELERLGVAQELGVGPRHVEVGRAQRDGGARGDVLAPEDTALDLSRTARYSWPDVTAQLESGGACLLPGLLSPEECAALIALGDDPGAFEHEVRLGERGHGEGLYRFLRRPLPPLVAAVRAEFYRRLVACANGWRERLGEAPPYPATHARFLDECAARGQTRTTPILFRYERGASNALHRDASGEWIFPFQVAVTLGPASAGAGDGAEFLFADAGHGKRRATRTLAPGVGDGVVFCTHWRPMRVGTTWGRVATRHGVAPLRGERRFALGLPLHDDV